MGARLYHYPTARFLSADPLGHASDMSLYSYANNDPVNGVDPSGRAVDGFTSGVTGFSAPGSSNSKTYQWSAIVGAAVSGAIESFGNQVDQLLSPITSPTPVINWPVSSLAHYILRSGEPVTLGPNLIESLQNLQKANPQSFPLTNQPTNITWNQYGSWSHPLDTINVGLSLGQFRYTNDGESIQVMDIYAFPFSQSDHNGGTSKHNAILSIFLATLGDPYPISGTISD
ncbi:MAG: hypothetical protein NZM04_08910 [Methylacidiphilales bacterium]|nr:hypothetical protein [Candidatus Methylacidiphilales bacterium]